jgi:hypothetical protein
LTLNNPWVLCGAGIIFCITAIILFRKTVFEEGKSIAGSIIIMLMGIALIGLGTAKYYNLID